MNYQYPPTYPYYPAQIPQQITQPVQQPIQANQNQLIMALVQTEKEAVNYPLLPNQSMFLMNQREPYLYMKAVDQLGKITFVKKKLLDESDNNEKDTDFIKREEIENLISDRIQKEIEKKMSEISFKPTKNKRTEED
jgi:predicted phage tail protein